MGSLVWLLFSKLKLVRWGWFSGAVAGLAALTPGKHTIVFDFKYDGPGPGRGVDLGDQLALAVAITIPHR